MMPKTVFYARVSTRDQNLDGQIEAARRLGVKPEFTFIEKASGVRHDRPVLAKALTALAKGDTLAAFKLDRVGRSLVHLLAVLDDLEKRGVHFMTTEDGLSTKGSTGKLVLQILGSVAEFERSLMMERTRAGLAAARAKGKVPGRRQVMLPKDVERARDLMAAGELNSHEIANLLKVSRATLFRALRRAREMEHVANGG